MGIRHSSLCAHYLPYLRGDLVRIMKLRLHYLWAFVVSFLVVFVTFEACTTLITIFAPH